MNSVYSGLPEPYLEGRKGRSSVERSSLMSRFRRRENRAVRRLVRALAALEDDARVVRPQPRPLIRAASR
jgi:hypothetical protein